jgi:hypothetical protein
LKEQYGDDYMKDPKQTHDHDDTKYETGIMVAPKKYKNIPF